MIFSQNWPFMHQKTHKKTTNPCSSMAWSVLFHWMATAVSSTPSSSNSPFIHNGNSQIGYYSFVFLKSFLLWNTTYLQKSTYNMYALLNEKVNTCATTTKWRTSSASSEGPPSTHFSCTLSISPLRYNRHPDFCGHHFLDHPSMYASLKICFIFLSFEYVRVRVCVLLLLNIMWI